MVHCTLGWLGRCRYKVSLFITVRPTTGRAPPLERLHLNKLDSVKIHSDLLTDAQRIKPSFCGSHMIRVVVHEK